MPLPWDSGFFGVNIAQISASRATGEELAEAIRQSREAGIDCIYFLADANDQESVRAAEANRFSLVDIRLTLECTIGAAGSAAYAETAREANAVRHARPDDVPRLMALARASHRNSRFYQDGRFDPARCDELYAIWIQRSVLGELADAVWVVDVDGAPRGYLTIRNNVETAAIGLVAVDPEHRARGYGSQLVRAALQWAVQQGLRRVSVVTQGRSTAAMRFYQRSAFAPSLVQLCYHWWSDGRDPR